MAATFRSFLAGIGAAMPKIIDILEETERMKLQERQVAVQESYAKEAKRSNDLQENVYKNVTLPQSETMIDSTKLRDNLAKEQAEIDRRISKATATIQESVAKYSDAKTKKEVDLLDANIKKASADLTLAYAQAGNIKAQTQKIGMDMGLAGVEFKYKMAGVMSSAMNDKKALEFMTKEFGSQTEMLTYLMDNGNQFSPEFSMHASGLIGDITQMMKENLGVEAQIIMNSENPKKGEKNLGMWRNTYLGTVTKIMDIQAPGSSEALLNLYGFTGKTTKTEFPINRPPVSSKSNPYRTTDSVAQEQMDLLKPVGDVFSNLYNASKKPVNPATGVPFK
jgi:uncharacterized glyoxalase superfamily protein PhnB